MAQFTEMEAIRSNLEKNFAQLVAQLHIDESTQNTVAKLAEALQGFMQLMFNMLQVLRHQSEENFRMIDAMETRHRRKALLFLGIAETESEVCSTLILFVINTMLELNNIPSSSIKVCHRIGDVSSNDHRPILVWFSTVDSRSDVWQAQSKLEGSAVSVKEFLTKPRQKIFNKAQEHYGMEAVWSQDGTIVVKVANDNCQEVTTMDELNCIIVKYPKASGSPFLAPRDVNDIANMSGANTESRKN